MSALRSLLSVALLLPLAFVASLVWGHTSGEGKSVDLERKGTEYFRALLPLEIALLDAQSAAVSGQAVPQENLDRAVQTVAEVDARLGDDLRSRQRWGEVRARIEALPNGGSAGVDAVFASYTETTSMLLALFDKVRNSAKVILDPETDTYFLHDGVTQELPSAVAAAGELADLTVLIAGKTPQQRGTVLTDILTRRIDLDGSTGDLVDDIQFSVDSTQSPTLGGNLLGRLDRFRRVVDSIIPATAALSASSGKVDAALMTKNRTEAQAAAGDLSQAMLRELDLLLADRQSTLRQELLLGTLSLLAIAALVVGGLVLDLVARRRRAVPARSPDAGAHAQPPPAATPETADVEPDPWERYVATR